MAAPAYSAPITQGGGDGGNGGAGSFGGPTSDLGGVGGVGGGGGGGAGESSVGGDGAQVDQPARFGEAGASGDYGLSGAGGAPGCAPNCDADDVDLSAGGGGGGGDGSYSGSFPGDGGAGGAGGSGTIRTGDVTLDQDVAGDDGADVDFSDDLFDVGGGGGGGAGLILEGDGATLQTDGHAVAGGAGGDGNGGGGGGAGVVATDGGVITVDADGSITGGAGGPGSNSGDGGAGAFLLNGGALHNAGDITGGGASEAFGASGDGGAGLLSNNGSVTNTGAITGGAGGVGAVEGGDSESIGSILDSGDGGIGLRGYGGEIVNQAGATITGGDGGTSAAEYHQYRSGDGGAGVSLTDGGGGTLTNFGTIAGGDGGTANVLGTGGLGVDVADDGVRVINGGRIAGGLDGDESTRADALHLAGDDNVLELRAGYAFTGDVVASGDNTTLALGGGDDAVLNVGQIGAGQQYQGFTAFDKIGESTWTLSDTTSAVTPWTIEAGALAISRDANLGDASGGLTLAGGTLEITADGFASARAVTLDTAGTVQVDTGNATLAGVLADGDGAGALTKTGDGTLNLTGANTYSGGTTIAAGTLRGTTTSLQGDIVDDAALVFDQAGDGAYAGSLSGDGTVLFTGGATYALTGDSGGFAGAGTVADSTLTIDGTLGGSLNIVQGARLQGTGTVGDTTIADGGTIAPGNSIGTLHVDGDVTFAAGSRYEVEVQPGGTDSDLILATGSAIIDGGAVAHIGLDGDYAPNARYAIVTANQGVTGTFDGVTSDFAFLDPFLDYDPNDVYLVLQRNATDFVDTARTPNQHAAADGTEPLGPGDPVYDSVVKLSEPEARDAFDRLSGEIHATTQTALIQDSRYLRQAMLQRMRGAAEAHAALPAKAASRDRAAGDDLHSGSWVRAIGAFGGTDGDGNAAELDRSTRGVLFGSDTQVADYWRIGATAGFTRSGFDVDARRSTGHSDNFHGGLYTGTQNTPVRFTLGAGYTWHTIDTQRSVAFRGFTDRLQSSHQAGTAQVFGELGYALDLGAATVEPFVNGIYVNLDNDGFAERGGSAALHVEAEETDITFSTLGLRTAGTVELAGTTIALHGSAGWRHAYGDTTPTVTNAYAGGGPAFTVAGLPIEDDSAIVDAGVGVDIGDNATLGVSYGGLFGSAVHDNAGKLDVTVRF